MKKLIHISLFLLLACSAGAQYSLTNKAKLYYQENILDKAIETIDSAVTYTGEKDDAHTWFVRGFLYKARFKANEIGKEFTPSRDEAIASFRKSLSIAPGGPDAANVRTDMNYLAASYYNEMVNLLDTINYPKCEKLYIRYKEVTRMFEPSSDFRSSDKKFYLALGVQIARKFNFRREDSTYKYFEEAIDKFKKVLAVDSLDYDAHYQVALMYYNFGVETVMNLPPDLPIDEVIAAQDKCAELFLKSLPHMNKAYELSSGSRKVDILKALMAIYWQLNEMKQYEELKLLLQKLEDKGNNGNKDDQGPENDR
jgi:tetratricopeptide (TPR) repeat protein